MSCLLLRIVFSYVLAFTVSNCYGYEISSRIAFKGQEYIEKLAKVDGCTWENGIFSIHPTADYKKLCLWLAATGISAGGAAAYAKFANKNDNFRVTFSAGFFGLISGFFACYEGATFCYASSKRAQYVGKPILTLTSDYLEKLDINFFGTKKVTKIPWKDFRGLVHNASEKTNTDSLTIKYQVHINDSQVLYTFDRFLYINETKILPLSLSDITQVMMHYAQLAKISRFKAQVHSGLQATNTQS